MNKRFFVLGLAAVFAVMFAGCDNGSTDTGGSSQFTHISYSWTSGTMTISLSVIPGTVSGGISTEGFTVENRENGVLVPVHVVSAGVGGANFLRLTVRLDEEGRVFRSVQREIRVRYNAQAGDTFTVNGEPLRSFGWMTQTGT